MSLTRPITFVAAVNNRQVFEENLFASACLRAGNNHQLLAQAGFASASLAYNDAMDRASNEVMVFAHQDVFFPPLWLSQLEAALAYLGNTDPRWGVLGCWGVTQHAPPGIGVSQVGQRSRANDGVTSTPPGGGSSA